MGSGSFVRLLFALTAAAVAVHMASFAVSIDAGFAWVVQYVYALPQDPAGMRRDPLPIYLHIYGNGLALLLGMYQWTSTAVCDDKSVRPPPQRSTCWRWLHPLLGAMYLFALTIGSCASLVYATRQHYGPDRGVAAVVSFGSMAASALVPAWAGAVQLLVYDNAQAHGALMHRSVVALFSSFVVFRALARWALPWALTFTVETPPPGATATAPTSGSGDVGYALWVCTIWLSWYVPVTVWDYCTASYGANGHAVRRPTEQHAD